jgi:hypothetical protein
MGAASQKTSDSDPKAIQAVGDGIISDDETNLGVDEKKLLRKLDLHIIPLVMLLCELKPFPSNLYISSVQSHSALVD